MNRLEAIAIVSGMALPVMAVPAGAQSTASSVAFPGGYAPGSAPCVRQADDSCTPVSAAMPMPVALRQESLTLANANAAAAAQPAFGGTYALNQTCTSYAGGSLALRYRGPDGATMLTFQSKSASDAAGGTLVTLAGGTVVDVTLPAGSTGCNANLVRVP